MDRIPARILRLSFLALLLATAVPLAAQPIDDSAVTRTRTVTQVADGVYVIRHPDAPDAFPQSNTTVVIGEREVLVVDACYLPSSAREDIAQIREWTDKPVRYLVNTHWHVDHTMGNGVYWDAFPGLAIVAHAQTAQQSAGYNPGFFARYPTRGERIRALLEAGTDQDGNPFTDAEKQELQAAIDGVAPVQAEYAQLVDRAPNLTFEEALTLDLGGRVVQIRYLGRGNTAGDAVVYLPQERIVVAGDLIVHPVPYLGSGYPFDMVETLQKIAWMDVATIVPGHGSVLEGDYADAYLNQLIAFLQEITTEVSRQVHRIGGGPRNLEAVREAVLATVDIDAWRQKFVRGNTDNLGYFDDFSLPGVVNAAYAQVWGQRWVLRHTSRPC